LTKKQLVLHTAYPLARLRYDASLIDIFLLQLVQ
jgi:hypothetical protein